MYFRSTVHIMIRQAWSPLNVLPELWVQSYFKKNTHRTGVFSAPRTMSGRYVNFLPANPWHQTHFSSWPHSKSTAVHTSRHHSPLLGCFGDPIGWISFCLVLSVTVQSRYQMKPKTTLAANARPPLHLVLTMRRIPCQAKMWGRVTGVIMERRSIPKTLSVLVILSERRLYRSMLHKRPNTYQS